MEASQVVTVKNTNITYSDNTNPFFRVRPPQTLNFNKACELGLLDVTTPTTVHNVQADAYFTLALYGQTPKLLPEDNNSAHQTVTESGSAGYRVARKFQDPGYSSICEISYTARVVLTYSCILLSSYMYK